MQKITVKSNSRSDPKFAFEVAVSTMGVPLDTKPVVCIRNARSLRIGLSSGRNM